MTNYEDITTALALCVVTQHPVILWGLPGQGKTSVIEAMAEHYQIHMETVIASTFEPADFGGLPVVNHEENQVDRLAFGWAKRAAAHEKSIVFYDEISTAPPSVQAALLRPILSDWVGDFYMGPGIISIAAANPPDVAADGWDLPAPSANRFVHIDWALDADTVRQGFTVGWPQVNFPTIDPDVYARTLREAMTLTGVFLGSKPDLLTKMPDSSEAQGRAYPTPRSWEAAAALYAAAKAAGAGSAVEALLVIGCVGPAAGNTFLHYLDNLDLPDPEKLLADPESFVVPSEHGDKVFAIAASAWSAVDSNTTPERWLAYGTILSKIADAGHGDVAYLYGRHWVEARPEGTQPTKSIFKAIAPILGALNAG